MPSPAHGVLVAYRRMEPEIGIPAPPEGTLVREDFTPLAAFRSGLVTGADGEVEAGIQLPHTLTRYRIRARAVEGPLRSGSGTSSLVVDQDFVVRATPPRFLRSGDEGEITLTVQNNASAPRTVVLGLRSEALALVGGHGVRFTLPAGGRRTVGIPVRADQVGEARFEVQAAGGDAADALAMAVSVEPPAPTNAMAVRQVLDSDAPMSVPLRLPGDVRNDVGGLDVVVSGSALAILRDEVEGLLSPRFVWTDLRTGRLRLATALHDRGIGEDLLPDELMERLLETAWTDARSLQVILRQYARGVTDLDWLALRVGAGQHDLPAAAALVTAVLRFEEVRPSLGSDLSASLATRFAQEVQRLEADPVPSPVTGADRSRLEAQVALAWALREAGVLSDEEDRQVLGSVMDRSPTDLAAVLEDLAPSTLARLAAHHGGAGSGVGAGVRGGEDALEPGEAAMEAFLEILSSRAQVSSGSVTFATARPVVGTLVGDQASAALVPSSPREDAAVLEALLDVMPEHTLVSGLVRGLSARSSAAGGRIDGATAPVLAALVRHTAMAAPEVPHARVRVGVGDRSVLEASVTARLHESGPVHLPMADLTADGSGPTGEVDTELRIQREGTGSPHLRALLRWSPADPFQPPEARGLAVRRWFEALDEEDDVRLEEDGSWTIRAGARVRIHTEVLAPARRADVLLTVPLPAGLEALNPRLENPAVLFDPQDSRGLLSLPMSRIRLPHRHWLGDRQILSDRVEAWAPEIPAGVHRMATLAIAVTPGLFIAPAPMVHEGGAPDVYGRGEAVRVRVVEWPGRW